MIVSCPSCGNGNPPWARRCTRCGEPLDGQGVRTPAERYKVTVRPASAAEPASGTGAERPLGQSNRPPVTVPPKLREVRRPIDTMERDPQTGVPIPPARLANVPVRTVAADPQPAPASPPAPSAAPVAEPPPPAPLAVSAPAAAPVPVKAKEETPSAAPARDAKPAAAPAASPTAASTAAAATRATAPPAVPAAPAPAPASTPAAAPTPTAAPTPRQTLEPIPASTTPATSASPGSTNARPALPAATNTLAPRVSTPAANSLANLAPPRLAEPRLPEDFRLPEQPAPRLPEPLVAKGKQAEPRLPLSDPRPELARGAGTTLSLPGFDDAPGPADTGPGQAPATGRQPTPEHPARTGRQRKSEADARADGEPILSDLSLAHLDEDPRIALRDTPSERQGPPSAALELPVPNRTVRNLLAAAAVIVVVAIGVTAFVAVVQTAPESPQQESAIDRLATRAIERLESWGLR